MEERGIGTSPIDLTDISPLGGRSGTDGFQPKYILGDKFIKVQCRLNGNYIRDPEVEYLSSCLMEALGIYHIPQKICTVKLGASILCASVSPLKQGEFTSFSRLLEMFEGARLSDVGFNKMEAWDKLWYLASKLSSFTGVALSDTLSYMRNLALIDVLVCNTDRHAHNFGCWDGSIAPIFDCGMGMFVQLPGDSYESALRQSYIEPYGEDPFDLIELLGLRVPVSVDLHRYAQLCPDGRARRYYEEVLRHVYA